MELSPLGMFRICERQKMMLQRCGLCLVVLLSRAKVLKEALLVHDEELSSRNVLCCF